VIKVRPAESIYRKEGGWFDARWHFSFDDYYDPEFMSFGTMRVFNDDRLIPGAIWPMHPHRDIEGLTYVVEGTFRHEDSLGNGGVFPAGSVQRMTLGSGAYHSEQNGSEDEPLRFIQIWIMPRERGLAPGVEQKEFTREDRTNRLLRAIGPDRDERSILVHQDAAMYISHLDAGASVDHAVRPSFGAYVYLIEGSIEVNSTGLTTGDAAMIADEAAISIAASTASELIMVEVQLS
jgi:redox-sensitive bicupin YhaK (pirin superfamily)